MGASWGKRQTHGLRRQWSSESKRQAVDIFRRLPLAQGLDEAHLAALVSTFKVKTFKNVRAPAHVLFHCCASLLLLLRSCPPPPLSPSRFLHMPPRQLHRKQIHFTPHNITTPLDTLNQWVYEWSVKRNVQAMAACAILVTILVASPRDSDIQGPSPMKNFKTTTTHRAFSSEYQGDKPTDGQTILLKHLPSVPFSPSVVFRRIMRGM